MARNLLRVKMRVRISIVSVKKGFQVSFQLTIDHMTTYVLKKHIFFLSIIRGVFRMGVKGASAPTEIM